MDVNIILQLAEEGLTHKQIAERLGITIGKLNYQLTKHRKASETSSPQAEEEGFGPFDDLAALEQHHGAADRLTALPRDPECLYACWEITDGRKRMTEEHFHCGWGELPKYLRVYDVSYIHFNGDNANRHWLIAVNQEASNWFVKGLASGCDYIVDYGTTALDGRFITLLRSNPVRIPPSGAAGWQSPRSAVVDMSAELPEPPWQRSFTGYTLSSST
ncbi:DUF4912 domain-containing protein [Paenibacillus sp. MBLB4367]|uniref:DUF4912 domain-containing protein n=1 Tax=Paenibacillus sp. MBLB4367 TaxID=3384767 RepID=UPI003907F0D7